MKCNTVSRTVRSIKFSLKTYRLLHSRIPIILSTILCLMNPLFRKDTRRCLSQSAICSCYQRSFPRQVGDIAGCPLAHRFLSFCFRQKPIPLSLL